MVVSDDRQLRDEMDRLNVKATPPAWRDNKQRFLKRMRELPDLAQTQGLE